MHRIPVGGVTLLFLIMSLAGCATGGKMQKLQEGLTEADVVSVMGRPDGMMREGEYKALKWANRLMSGWSWDRADYWVVLRRDLVVAYGPGEVRQNGPGVLILIPIGK